MKIGVISDTHIPRMARDIPKAVYDGFKEVDLILHAGDLVEIKFLEKLRKFKKTVAVSGNMDSKEITAVLKPKEIIEAGNFRIGLIHGWGPPEGLAERILAEFKGEKVDCIVFGHSHHPINETIKGILFFNPGSASDKIFTPYNSYGILEITDKITGKIIKLQENV
ncbi:MAG: metallophosphoesterase family protein [Candidatus Omnitrophota bacterium]|nr:metallophosphoesterase family protein [Candidatus Omnitrophota bacterium]MDP3786658.1 metallophosphoesterase family protein [Candidatus Omnitrophota bacterium]